ncbi:hypothetical protein KC726_01675 [Candidatus Woesebacteria bacterium]|nr:hypothetical protein [Candidatus Woesebacteria bacterium]
MEGLFSFATVSSGTFVYFFIRAFAIIFSLMYFLYAIVITKQTQSFIKTITTTRRNILLFISFSQIILGLILVASAIFIL